MTHTSVRCNNSSAIWWLYICRCKCLLPGACCLGVVRATGGCTVGAMGGCCTASEVDRVVMGCSATSTLGCMSGLTASG